ncbi:tryptophan-rich sensory protein [Microbacterium sp. GXF7504]
MATPSTAAPAPAGRDVRSTGTDVLRQTVVIAATCFMLVAAVIGAGVLGGTPVQDLQDGALSADATYLAPASPAFSIWSVVYVGLVAFAIWQALPAQRADARLRRLGWWIALSEVLNGLWLVAAQFLTLPLTVLVIALLLVNLCIVFAGTVRRPGRGWVDRLLVNGVNGLHLGWVTLATVANTTAWLTETAPAEWESAAEIWGSAVLLVVAVVGMGLAGVGGGRLAPALALSWGLSWLAVGRLTDEPHSTVIGVLAVVVAVLVLATAVIRRVRTVSRTRAASAPAR